MNKNERIHEIEAGGILEAAQEQLRSTQLEFTRITHNIEAVIANLETAIEKLMKGGE